MINQQTEFLICQYLDGELPEEERAAVEQLLAENAEARDLAEEYRKLDAVLKQAKAVPAVRWDALAEHISTSIDRQEREEEAQTASRWRIGMRMAIAASVLLASGIAVQIFRWSTPGTPTNPTGGNAPVAIVQVEGPKEEVAAAPGVVEISIGAGPQVADSANGSGSGSIAIAEPLAQDTDAGLR